jgi:hypothetical protein
MRHLGKARALAAEKILHAGTARRLAAAERIDPFRSCAFRRWRRRSRRGPNDGGLSRARLDGGF